MLVAVLFFAR